MENAILIPLFTANTSILVEDVFFFFLICVYISTPIAFSIDQVEAYRPNDSACHARFGITARTAPVVRSMIFSIFCIISKM